MATHLATEQKAGTSAIIAIISALSGFVVTAFKHPGWGMALALAAIIFGMVGLLTAASPKVGGGLLSVVSMVLGVLCLVLSIVVLIGVIVF